MGKATYKVKGGKMIKVNLDEEEGKIRNIKIMGDFFLHPEELIEELEKALVGQPLKEADLAEAVSDLLSSRGATLLGASPLHFAKCILMAGERDG